MKTRNSRKPGLTFGNKQSRDTRIHVPKIQRPKIEAWKENLPTSSGSVFGDYVLDVMKLS